MTKTNSLDHIINAKSSPKSFNISVGVPSLYDAGSLVTFTSQVRKLRLRAGKAEISYYITV